MLKRYQRPNNRPSSSVLAKLLDLALLSPALSGTEAALTSKRLSSSPELTEGTELHGLSLNDEEEETDQDRRGKDAETATLLRSRGFGEEEESRIGSNLGLEEARRGFNRGRDWETEEREKAELCIFEVQRLRSEGNPKIR